MANPGAIMQCATGFWASKTLLTAIEFKLFSALAKKSSTAKELSAELGMCYEKRPRAVDDFLDALVSLGFLDKENDVYSNKPDVDLFLDNAKPSYIGDFLNMLNMRLYGFWGNLGEALRTGDPQNELKGGGELWAMIYATPESIDMFCSSMRSFQMGSYMAICDSFSDIFTESRPVVMDAGGSDGHLLCMLADKFPHITKGINLEMECVISYANQHVEKMGKSDKVVNVSGSFFEPITEKADVVVLGNILHDWNEEEKKNILKNCYDALNDGGALLCVEMIMDDEKKAAVPAFLMSLNMLIETPGGFNFSNKEFQDWCSPIGFSKFDFKPIVGGSGVAIAYK